METFSVIIPTFNEETTLPKLLAMIREQTRQPLEVIIADANSTDTTREIARAFEVKVVEGGLPGAGRNYGAKVAKGDWLLFLDADAVIESHNFLERSLAELQARQLDCASVRVTATRDWRAKCFFWIFSTYVRLTTRFFPHAVGTCLFARQSLHEAIGGFDETILYAEDADYAQRASQQGHFGILHERIATPPRRFERDGYLRSGLMNLGAEFHLRFFGPIRTDIFRYRFGHNPKGKK